MDEFSKKYSRKHRTSKTGYRFLKILDKIPIPNLLLHNYSIKPFKVLNENSIILNIGSKTKHKFKNWINMDIVDGKYNDFVGDVQNIPLENNSVDFVNVVAVLHHVINPYKAVDEIYRVLKKEGYIYCEDHFYFPYHPDPKDISRFTMEGAENLFSKFEKIKMVNLHGPTTTVLIVLQYYFPILFSFNNIYLYEILYILFSYLLYPLKFLDVLLKKHWKADFISGGFAYLGKKL